MTILYFIINLTETATSNSQVNEKGNNVNAYFIIGANETQIRRNFMLILGSYRVTVFVRIYTCKYQIRPH